MKAKQILRQVVDETIGILDELYESCGEGDEFCAGLIYAHVSMLEKIQSILPRVSKYGLDFTIEDKYPLV